MRIWSPTVTPPWLARAVVALAVAFGVLTLALDHDGVLTALTDQRHDWSPGRFVPAAGLVLVLVAVWVLEAGGIRCPRLARVAAAGLPLLVLLLRGNLLIAPLFSVLLVGWSAYVDNRRFSLLTFALMLAAVVPPMAVQKETPGDWITWVLGLGVAWVTARTLAAQQRLLAELRAAQADLARQAAAEERRRIAREVHDVIAHALSVTLLHLTGARHVLLRDPRQAAEALATAEQLGRQSLADIRRTIGLLAAEPGSENAPEAVSAPLPDATDLTELVASYAAAGLAVTLTVEGDPARLSAAAGLGLYRIAQEALANVAKHAPGAGATVELRIDDGAAELRVDSTSGTGGRGAETGGGTGLGIRGMRDRARLLGGALTAGPREGGWVVECRIPITLASPASA